MSNPRRKLLALSGSLLVAFTLTGVLVFSTYGPRLAVLVAFGLLFLNAVVIAGLILWLLQKPTDRS